jgi:hypothetical protein
VDVQIPIAMTTVTANYTVKRDEYIINVNGSAPVTITLLPSAGPGEAFLVKDVSGNAVVNNITVVTSDSKLIDGQANYLMQTNYQGATFIFDGTSWRVY